MLAINARNVNEAMPLAIMNMESDYVKEVSPRGMNTIEYPSPVCTIYKEPRERVLFIPERHANPYFHFMESLWIMDGRNDVAFLAYFNKRMVEFSDDGKTFHASYGYRLRHHFGKDQLFGLINLFKKDIDTRRGVLTIWDPMSDLNVDSRDIPCNDIVFFKVRGSRLNMTVCCRSNDLIWGAYGANVVQFSVLQEVLASMIGVEVGEYRQISDSFHVYTDNPQWQALKGLTPASVYDPYSDMSVEPYPMVADPNNWFKELHEFINRDYNGVTNPFFVEVANPMLQSWDAYKDGDMVLAQSLAFDIEASDWRRACLEWLSETIRRRDEKM